MVDDDDSGVGAYRDTDLDTVPQVDDTERDLVAELADPVSSLMFEDTVPTTTSATCGGRAGTSGEWPPAPREPAVGERAFRRAAVYTVVRPDTNN